MSEEIKEQTVIENEIKEDEESKKELLRDEVFESFKKELLENKTILEKFLRYSKEHNSLEFTEFSEPEEIEESLRKANKLRDKLLKNIEQKYDYILESSNTNTTIDMITAQIDTQGYQYKVVIEALDEGFNLEVL